MESDLKDHLDYGFILIIFVNLANFFMGKI
mgnify:CR=1 FL=1